MKILIQLPRNRWDRGFLSVVGTDFGCFCLGRAEQAAATKAGNPTRNPLFRNGDTPLGTYVGTIQASSWGTSPARLRSYGPYRAIKLEPTGGDALTAKKNGRSGLAIHGGALSIDGRVFRPTHGCIRLSDYYMAALLAVLDASGSAKHDVEIVEFPTA